MGNAPKPPEPIRVGILNDYQIIVEGLRRMLEAYPHIHVVAAGTGNTIDPVPDVVLIDTFAAPQPKVPVARALLENYPGIAVALYTWDLDPRFIDRAIQDGLRGVISKGLDADELVTALVRLRSGEEVVVDHVSTLDPPGLLKDAVGLDLTDREIEMLVLCVEGLTNKEIGARLDLSPNTVKKHLSRVYFKGSFPNRAAAVAWATERRLLAKLDQIS